MLDLELKIMPPVVEFVAPAGRFKCVAPRHNLAWMI
jgi:hypothetical protein